MVDKFPKREDYTSIRREIEDLKRQIRELGGQTRARATSITGEDRSLTVQGGADIILNDGGELAINDGGHINVHHGGSIFMEDGGALVLNGGTIYVNNPGTGQNYGFIGFIVNIPDPEGNLQSGFAFYRHSGDGNLAIALYDPDPNSDTYNQVIQIRDGSNNVVFQDDPAANGLEKPYLTMSHFEGGDGYGVDGIKEITDTFVGIPPEPDGNWWRPIGGSHGYRTHPFLRVKARVLTSGSATGSLRVTVNETVVWGTNIAAGGDDLQINELIDVEDIAHYSEMRVKFLVNRTDSDAGSGMWAQYFGTFGVGRP
jgi:hypothetical protein